MKKLMVILLILLLPLAVRAEVLTGTVVAGREERLITPGGGTLVQVLLRAGQQVYPGTEAATLKPEIVAAPCAGTVTLFGCAGDDASAVSRLYGAVGWIEPDAAYTLDVSIEADSPIPGNQLIHPGESVYLCCTELCMHMGRGVVTQVAGEGYTVLVTEGEFLFGESVDVCRSGDCTGENCIGTGMLRRVLPIPLTGEGLIVYAYVASGMHVEAGDELYELAATMDGHILMNDCGGVVAQVLASPGDVLAVIWPEDAMRVAFPVPQAQLNDWPAGSCVTLTFADGSVLPGVIEWVEGVPAEGLSSVCYTAYAAFEATESVRFGMTVSVAAAE